MQKLETQTDYWLAQYQRLLDSKPQCLIDQVTLTHSLLLVVAAVMLVLGLGPGLKDKNQVLGPGLSLEGQVLGPGPGLAP